MITKENLREVLERLGFKPAKNKIMKKIYQNDDRIFIEVDFLNSKITYSPIDNSFQEGEFPNKNHQSNGIIIHRNTTTNFSANENFVCLICMDRLLSKGYKPQHIILEPAIEVGHVNKPSYGDILVYNENYERLALIENKTYGSEFAKEWNNMQKDGGQLFSYVAALGKCDWVCLYAADFDKEIIYNSYLITLKDNEEYLNDQNANIKKEEEKKSYFKNATNQAELFKVWNESYQTGYSTKGLFEDDISAYKIGKEKYTLNDLNKVPYTNIRAIYNEFATILRNNAIGNYENTFYILVDLFLCKIVDEKNMQNGKSDELKFYWKGFGSDTPLEYCDRLLELYAQGKKELFEVDVVNINKNKIDEIFDRKKRYKGELRNELDKLFKEQKFYNIKKFNFIEVENKQEFDLNFKVLLHIANLIQDIYITKSENNQFLGDLFEGFLNRSIHQTEGRFFTPTPITNFIINSLPNFKSGDKILDYACGAGHFLTEFIQHNGDCKIYGIEKNKNLSMVAKIATVFYDSKNEAKIIFQDTLEKPDQSKDYARKFEDESFDLIISNPPYSVKGFLDTLSQNDREKFDLLKQIDSASFDKNNAIECFFIERTAQLLKEGGYFALILPVSILSKGGIYETTREILLSKFDILSIVGLNSRTFGSTGTQTVIVFAKKREKEAGDLIKCFINTEFELIQEFVNHDIIAKYCAFKGFNKDEFIDFLKKDILSNNLAQSEIFKNYKDEFENTSSKVKEFKKEAMSKTKQNEFFENSSFYKAELNKKEKKAKFDEFLQSNDFKILEQEFYDEQFIEKCKNLELSKLKFYAFINNNELLLVKSPEDKKQGGDSKKSNKDEIIKFLGYDWSSRKGDEGIKYVTSVQTQEELKDSDDDSDDEKKEKEALRNINSVKFIQTPLYNPQDKNDKTKICYALKSFFDNNFDDELLAQINPNDVNSFSIQKANLIDLMDFGKTNFDKAINLSARNKVEIVSQYPLVRLGSVVVDIINGSTPSKSEISFWNAHDILWFSTPDYPKDGIYIEASNVSKFVSKEALTNNKVKLIPKGSVLLSCTATLGKVAINNIELTTNQQINSIIFDRKEIIPEFFTYLFKTNRIKMEDLTSNPGVKHINITTLKNIQIPKPRLEIQEQIVSECKKVDNEFKTTRMEIDELKAKLSKIFSEFGISFETNGGGYELISKFCDILIGGTPKRGNSAYYGGENLWLSISEMNSNVITDTKEKITNLGVKNSNVKLIPKDTTLVSFKLSIGKTAIAGTDLYTNEAIAAFVIKKEFKNKILNKCIFCLFDTKFIKLQKNGLNAFGQSLNSKDLNLIKIPLLPLSTQKQIVSEFEKLESEILQREQKLTNLQGKYNEILNRHL
ncbi:N-6 DNA methylase [Campylobacter concisus]|uniref:N-6 DNA methylase n=1 Tax=Campylobacter concisus TaxID=199 RepID=UPI00165F903F|nr:N-6 DNA methylase [Campylobacter concisus]